MLRRVILLAVPLLLALLGSPAPARAGDKNQLQLRLRDTLTAVEDIPTLSNNLIISNPSADTIHAQVLLVAEEGWRIITKTSQRISVAPGGKKLLPVSLVKQASQTAGMWTVVNVRIAPEGSQDTLKGRFFIKKNQIVRFKAENYQGGDLVFTEKELIKSTSLFLRNEGNSTMRYKVKWQMNRFNRKDQLLLELPPGKDTVIPYQLDLSTVDLKQLQSEMLEVHVQDDSNNKKFFHQRIAYCGNELTRNVSSYKSFPISVQAGMISRYTETSAYASINGHIPLGKTSTFDFAYRTKDYTTLNRFQSDIFSLAFNSRHFRAYAGQVQRNNDFYVFGNELSLLARWGTGGSFAVWAMKHYKGSFNPNDQVGTSLTYRLGKMKLEHSAIASLDSQRNMNGAIVSSKIHLFNSKHIKLSTQGGLGAAFKGAEMLTTALRQDPGYSLGGTLDANYGKFSLAAYVLQNTNNYPGVYRGLKNADYRITWKVSNQLSLIPFYTSNQISNNFGVDTILNTNRLRYNMERYGLRLAHNSKSIQINTSFGYYKNTVTVNMPRYQYGDINLTYRGPKAFQLMLRSQNGLAENFETGKKDIWFTSSSLSGGVKNFWLTGTYYRFPNLQRQYEGDNGTKAYTETMNAIASYRFKLFKRIYGNLDYEVARYAMNDIITHNAGGSIMYQGINNGFNLSIQGSMPVQKATEDNAFYLHSRNYLNITIGKSFNVPVITKKRYFDLKPRLFLDTNGNNTKEPGEPVIAQGLISINNQLFITGDDGMVRYNNIEPGTYTLDYTKVRAIEGYLPAHGYIETVGLYNDMVLDVPFRKARVISGTVRFLLDSFSNENYIPEGLKVTVSDSTGPVAHTLTNTAGNFSITLPAGHYTVSLNPDAFNEKMKPVRMSFPVDLNKDEKAVVNFEVQQKKREIRILNKNAAAPAEVKPKPKGRPKSK